MLLDRTNTDTSRVTDRATGSELSFTIAITTYNRASLVGRAIESAFAQDLAAAEVIVVDDASSDDTAQVIAARYPNVKYLRQERNMGCCAGRNRALREAQGRYVVILDDDDTLRAGALAEIQGKIRELAQAGPYPVFQMAHTGGKLQQPFMVLAIKDYILGTVAGDFLPVINRARFLEAGFAYPEIRSAGEHLLWWKVAERFGIPTWGCQVCDVHADAPVRLTSPEIQIAHAASHAELQERTLREFGDTLLKLSPQAYCKRVWGAATYHMLSGNGRAARTHLRAGLERKFSPTGVALWATSFLPARLIQKLFLHYRRSTLVTQ